VKTRRKTNENKLEIEAMHFEKIQSFKYLGSVVKQHNETEVLAKSCFNANCYPKDQKVSGQPSCHACGA
jgi:hypothetical protein